MIIGTVFILAEPFESLKIAEERAPIDVGVIILGWGTIGPRVAKAIALISNQATVQATRIFPHLLAVVDPKFADEVERELFSHKWQTDTSILESKKDLPRGLILNMPPVFSSLYDATVEAANVLKSQKSPVIVYDASPTKHHNENFYEIYRRYTDANETDPTDLEAAESKPKNWFYLGEKPIVDRTYQWKGIERTEESYWFFCDFIELVNPVVKATREYIQENGLKIKKMWFWRACGMGVNKSIGQGRKGVTGGAILDKGVHDLSISVELMRPGDVTGDVVERKSNIIHLIPDLTDRSGTRKILDINDDAVESINIRNQDNYPADGLCDSTVIWHSKSHGEVEGRYLFSWLGITDGKAEEEFRAKLREHGYNDDRYVLRHSVSGVNEEEVRLSIIECEDRTIICNFLTKPSYGSDTLNRYVYVHLNDGNEIALVPDLPSDPTVDLPDVLTQVARYCTRLDKPDIFRFGREAVTVVHSVLFDIQKAAVKGITNKDIDFWFDRAAEVIDGKRSD